MIADVGAAPRRLRIRRVLELSGDQLGYEMGMATTTTAEPVIQTHLRATLERRPEGDQS